MWTSAIVKVQVAANRSAGVADGFVGPQIYLFVFDAASRRSTNTLSRQAPLPSMLMAIPFLIRMAVNAVPVNWLP